jgi:hypothetical protein
MPTGLYFVLKYFSFTLTITYSLVRRTLFIKTNYSITLIALYTHVVLWYYGIYIYTYVSLHNSFLVKFGKPCNDVKYFTFVHWFTNFSNISMYSVFVRHLPEDGHTSDRNIQEMLLRLYFHKPVCICGF